MSERLGPETRAIIEAIQSLKKPAHENMNYLLYTIDLTAARVNELFELPGWFYNLALGKITGTATIRLNAATQPALDLTYIKTMNTPIRRFFITNDAQPGSEIILGIGVEATFAEPMRQGTRDIFRYVRYSEDGAVNTFETDTAKIDTPVLLLNTFRTPGPDLKAGQINRIHYRLNPTNAVTYTLRIWCNPDADNYRSNIQQLYESPAAQVDDTDYVEEDLIIPFILTLPGLMYMGIDWTAAPGVTPGFVEVSGERWS